MNTRYFPLLLLLPLTLILTANACAQDDEPGGVNGRQRLEQYRHLKMIEALDLNEEQAIRLFAREKEFRASEKARAEQRQDILARLRTLSKGTPSEADVQKEITALTNIAAEMAAARRDYVLGLKDLLSTKQIAQLVVFEDTFMKEVRRILESQKGRRLLNR
ncbi:MAG: hypothetical protein HY962_03865 [Ignavibacteriae bacterium]|nr:hypothetical protein [Ignavibacteriota bacterium]